MVPRGQQPGRGRFQFLLQEPCILVWKCVSPTVAHRGALEVPAKVAVLWGPMCWTGVTTASVGWQLIRRKSRFLSQGPYALGWIHVCTRLQLTEAPGGHLLGGQAWGPVCWFGTTVVSGGRHWGGGSLTYFWRSHAPLEVDSKGLQVCDWGSRTLAGMAAGSKAVSKAILGDADVISRASCSLLQNGMGCVAEPYSLGSAYSSDRIYQKSLIRQALILLQGLTVPHSLTHTHSPFSPSLTPSPSPSSYQLPFSTKMKVY